MLAIFLKTLPFFALIGLGYWAGRTRFFTAEATAYLTKFVFYFALSAMLFNFSANLSLAEVWDARLVAAYLWGTAFVYGIVISLFVLFNTFAVVQYLQYKKVGKWSDYLRGEKTYITLSLVAKSALAWQIFSGTLIS